MPRANIGSLSSVISHLDLSRLRSCSVSFGLDPVAMISSTCNANMVVPVGELH